MSKTEKIKKEKRKLQYFTLTKEAEFEFEKYIKDNFIDKSKLIEGLIKKYMEEKNNTNKND